MRRDLRLLSCVLLAVVPLCGCYVEARTGVAAEGEIVEAPPPLPPPPPPDPPPPPPSVEHFWIGSHYRWDGHVYVVVRGHYERRPRPNARYNGGHWEPRGRGHVWIEGRWD